MLWGDAVVPTNNLASEAAPRAHFRLEIRKEFPDSTDCQRGGWVTKGGSRISSGDL